MRQSNQLNRKSLHTLRERNDIMTNHREARSTVGWVTALTLICVGCGSGSSSSVGTCSGAFNACGGDPTGTWKVTGPCTEVAFATEYNALLASLGASCGNSVKSMSATVAGTLTYSEGTVTRDVTGNATGTLSLSAACINDMMGVSSVDASVCSRIQSQLYSLSTSHGTCNLAGASCNCSFTLSTPTAAPNGYNTYTVSGSTITESDDKSYEFCVSGNSMSQKSDATDTSGYSVATLTKS